MKKYNKVAVPWMLTGYWVVVCSTNDRGNTSQNLRPPFTKGAVKRSAYRTGAVILSMRVLSTAGAQEVAAAAVLAAAERGDLIDAA